jgi:peptidoglycan/xylan/chitin deacetylase (PgdA/CDA1 family)
VPVGSDGAAVRVGASDAGSPVRVRVIASTPDGRVRVAGGWRAPSPWLALPSGLARRGVVGEVRAEVEARDAAGNERRSGPVFVPMPSPPGRVVVVHSVATRRPYMALVFDDGYDPGAIRSILATLEARHAAATFCFNGENASRWSAALRAAMHRAVLEGLLSLCNHGYSHRTGLGTPLGAGLDDLRWNAVFDRAAGATTYPFYRPPYGALGPGLRAAAARLGYRYALLWSVDPKDFLRPPAAVVAQRVLSGARRGAITVDHALGPTARALPAILDGLAARGLRPVTMATLIRSGVPRG